MTRRAVSIIDVAAEAGVAVGTVSRAMNGGSISPATREKVERAVQRLGYVPSQAARNLKLRRTGIIGLVAHTTQAPWFTQLLHGVEVALRDHVASVVLCSLELTGDYDARPVMTWIREGRVDGLIVARPRRRERPIVKAALEAGLDVSLVLPDDAPRGARALRLDNEMGAAAAAEHLLALGHRRAAFFGGPESSVDSQGRLRGLRRSALEVAKRQVLHLGDFTVQAGARAAARYLSWRAKGSAPSAVVLANDAMALGFMRSVQVAGLRVPNDVSVVGFDGVPEGGLAVPALTTVLQPTHDIGFDACRLLLDDETEVRSGRYPMELLVRESTAAPPKPGSG